MSGVTIVTSILASHLWHGISGLQQFRKQYRITSNLQKILFKLIQSFLNSNRCLLLSSPSKAVPNNAAAEARGAVNLLCRRLSAPSYLGSVYDTVLQ